MGYNQDMRNRKEGLGTALVYTTIIIGLLGGIFLTIGNEREIQDNLPARVITLNMQFDQDKRTTFMWPEDLAAGESLIINAPLAKIGDIAIPGSDDLLTYPIVIDGPGVNTKGASEFATYSDPAIINMVEILLKKMSGEVVPCSIDPTSQSKVKKDPKYGVIVSQSIKAICE